jgi:uncharacterized membrane protein YkvA (DUF1232 family)
MPHWSWTNAIPVWAWIGLGVLAALIALVTLVGTIRLLVKLFRLHRHLDELPTAGKVAFWGSLIYTIFPFDLLPDPIYLDDMAVLGTAVVVLTRLWRKRHGNVPVPHGRKALPAERSDTTIPR